MKIQRDFCGLVQAVKSKPARGPVAVRRGRTQEHMSRLHRSREPAHIQRHPGKAHRCNLCVAAYSLKEQAALVFRVTGARGNLGEEFRAKHRSAAAGIEDHGKFLTAKGRIDQGFRAVKTNVGSFDIARLWRKREMKLGLSVPG